MTFTPKFTTRAAALAALDAAEAERDTLTYDGCHDDETIEAAEADVKAALEDLENAEIYEAKTDAA